MVQTQFGQANAPAARPSRIAETFARLKREGRTALMPYLTVGFPDVATTLAGVPALIRGGADLIELGMAFSDPLADGVTVQRANQRALAGGVHTDTVLDVTRQLRAQGVEAPLIAMGYFNPFMQYGVERFVAEGAAAGLDGLIIPDLPPEESDEVVALCRQYGRDLIMLLAPTSPDTRIADVARRATGFIYCISLTGITGRRESLQTGLADYLARIRRQTDLPLAVGFGISKLEHVAQVGQVAEGVIVGSALINCLEAVADRPLAERAAALEAFVRDLRGGA
ncbi:MAG: tryptophan synthase subunit alpha [Thermomicrobiales bacterium]